METESRQNRFGSYSFGVPATTAIGTLSGSLGGPIAAIIGAVVGPGWGIGLGLISPWLARRMPKLTRRWLSVAAFIATTLFGGSLFAMLLYVASPTPQNILNLMRPPLRRLHLFLIFNSLMEWLVIPVARLDIHLFRSANLPVHGGAGWRASLRGTREQCDNMGQPQLDQMCD
jgi:hypothetical protein